MLISSWERKCKLNGKLLTKGVKQIVEQNFKVIEMEKKQLEEERQKLEEEKVDKSIFSYSNKNKELSKPRR